MFKVYVQKGDIQKYTSECGQSWGGTSHVVVQGTVKGYWGAAFFCGALLFQACSDEPMDWGGLHRV